MKNKAFKKNFNQFQIILMVTAASTALTMAPAWAQPTALKGTVTDLIPYFEAVKPSGILETITSTIFGPKIVENSSKALTFNLNAGLLEQTDFAQKPKNLSWRDLGQLANLTVENCPSTWGLYISKTYRREQVEELRQKAMNILSADLTIESAQTLTRLIISGAADYIRQDALFILASRQDPAAQQMLLSLIDNNNISSSLRRYAVELCLEKSNEHLPPADKDRLTKLRDTLSPLELTSSQEFFSSYGQSHTKPTQAALSSLGYTAVALESGDTYYDMTNDRVHSAYDLASVADYSAPELPLSWVANAENRHNFSNMQQKALLLLQQDDGLASAVQLARLICQATSTATKEAALKALLTRTDASALRNLRLLAPRLTGRSQLSVLTALSTHPTKHSAEMSLYGRILDNMKPKAPSVSISAEAPQQPLADASTRVSSNTSFSLTNVGTSLMKRSASHLLQAWLHGAKGTAKIAAVSFDTTIHFVSRGGLTPHISTIETLRDVSVLNETALYVGNCSLAIGEGAVAASIFTIAATYKLVCFAATKLVIPAAKNLLKK